MAAAAPSYAAAKSSPLAAAGDARNPACEAICSTPWWNAHAPPAAIRRGDNSGDRVFPRPPLSLVPSVYRSDYDGLDLSLRDPVRHAPHKAAVVDDPEFALNCSETHGKLIGESDGPLVVRSRYASDPLASKLPIGVRSAGPDATLSFTKGHNGGHFWGSETESRFAEQDPAMSRVAVHHTLTSFVLPKAAVNTAYVTETVQSQISAPTWTYAAPELAGPKKDIMHEFMEDPGKHSRNTTQREHFTGLRGAAPQRRQIPTVPDGTVQLARDRAAMQFDTEANVCFGRVAELVARK